jgi:hypothetical protein
MIVEARPRRGGDDGMAATLYSHLATLLLLYSCDLIYVLRLMPTASFVAMAVVLLPRPSFETFAQ